MFRDLLSGLHQSPSSPDPGDRESKRSSARLRLLDPDPAAVAFDDPLADREPYTGSSVLAARVEALEHVEDDPLQPGTSNMYRYEGSPLAACLAHVGGASPNISARRPARAKSPSMTRAPSSSSFGANAS